MRDDATLTDLIGIRPGDVVAAIGGGGKTAVLEALAANLAGQANPVIMTTTTRIWPREGTIVLESGGAWPPAPKPGNVVTAASRLGPEGKLHGLIPETVCSLRADDRIILCEADGSAGRSLKVHGPDEPVIPACAAFVLCVAGLDVLGRALDETTVHRLGRWQSVMGERPDWVSATVIAAVLRIDAAHAPEGSRVIFVLNKASGRTKAAREVAQGLTGAGDLLISTERGVPVAGGTFDLR